MAPGDTQVVIVAIEVGQSTDRLASIDALKSTAVAIRTLYDAGILDGPTAVEAILVDSHAESEGVRLAWSIPLSGGTPVTVERRTMESAWTSLRETVVPEDRVLTVEDTDVIPGVRYGYRLAFWSGSERDYSSESWIEVPRAPEAPGVVRLLPGRPNPSSATFRTRQYVPREGRFRLSVLDVQGRVIRVLEDRPLSPGWHDSLWDGRDASGSEVGSGVYVLRIEGGGETAVQKLVLMR